MKHVLGETKHTNSENDTPYRKCLFCGRVIFEGEDYFDMTCPAKDLIRKKLEEVK